MFPVQVRLDAPTEAQARFAAEIMNVTVNRVKVRADCTQLYGTRMLDEPTEEASCYMDEDYAGT